MVDWLRSKTPALAVEVNNDQEANQFLEDNQVIMFNDVDVGDDQDCHDGSHATLSLRTIR